MHNTADLGLTSSLYSKRDYAQYIEVIRPKTKSIVYTHAYILYSLYVRHFAYIGFVDNFFVIHNFKKEIKLISVYSRL